MALLKAIETCFFMIDQLTSGIDAQTFEFRTVEDLVGFFAAVAIVLVDAQ